jgi:hypothetical protein
MGAGPSRRLLEDPFPVSSSLTRDLNKLSLVASRILGTADIYDVNNLTKSGTCGEYAVFLKEKITQQLLPFVAKLSDGTVAQILYQNPRKAIDNERDREEICSQLTSSMLRVIATVIACLGSIQIARPTGAPPVVQRGGSVTHVINWLAKAGYISAADAATYTAGKKLTLINRGARTGTPIFFLTFGDTRDGISHAVLTAETNPAGGGPEMPRGGFRVHFTSPIEVPGITESILPIRVTDTTSIPWMVGVLLRSEFQTLNQTNAENGPWVPADIWEQMFVRAGGAAGGTGTDFYENRDQMRVSNEIFNQFRRLNDPRVILNAVSTYLSRTLGYYAGYDAGAVARPTAYDMFGRPLPQIAPAPAGIIPRMPLPLQPAGPLGVPRPVAVTGATSYDIPTPSGKYITDALAAFRTAIPTLASPAAVRAHTLMTRVNPDRTIQTGVCEDPYWRQPSLGSIYPWQTLQFLCIENWKTMSADKRDPEGVLNADWKIFTEKLFDLYNNKYSGLGPRLTTNRGLLGQIKFEGATSLTLCKPPASQRITRLDIIQKGLVELHDLYDAHVRAMWDILNSLVVVIQLPESGTEVVRIHPLVFKDRSTSSKDYIEKKAAQARMAIIEFYINVENIYLKTIAAVSPPA